MLFTLAVLLIPSCTTEKRVYGTVETVEIPSELLGKTMRASVHLPDGYSADRRYPVLYFIPYAGGGPGIVTQVTQKDRECIEVLRSDATAPMIIVGVPHDASFLLDTEPPHRSVSLSSGITLSQGYYESFFLGELIPFIEKRYPVIEDRSGRYIGGYSLGGHAALRIALTYPKLFSRVGAHSPTLFDDDFPDPALKEFLYPDTATRKNRDPLEIVLAADIPIDTLYYLDTGENDINLGGCNLMYDRLNGLGAAVEYELFPGFHGTSYFQEHMPDYLRFYGSGFGESSE